MLEDLKDLLTEDFLKFMATARLLYQFCAKSITHPGPWIWVCIIVIQVDKISYQMTLDFC